MSWSLFLDELADDRGKNPYRVVAGLAIEDRHIWPLTIKINDANLHYFGRHLRSPNSSYVKADDLLSSDIFMDSQNDLALTASERIILAHSAISDSDVNHHHRIALAQAKISYCTFIINLIRDYNVRAFAILAPFNTNVIPVTNQLRRDYTFLLERFFYFVNDQVPPSMGYMICSDLNKYTISLSSIADYFLKTTKGKTRALSIMPEPLFARGRVNALFQATSLLAYILSWGFRTPIMNAPIRTELAEFTAIFRSMRYLHTASDGKKDWSFKYISEL